MTHEQLLLFTAVFVFTMLIIGLVLLNFEYRRQNKPDNDQHKNRQIDRDNS